MRTFFFAEGSPKETDASTTHAPSERWGMSTLTRPRGLLNATSVPKSILVIYYASQVMSGVSAAIVILPRRRLRTAPTTRCRYPRPESLHRRRSTRCVRRRRAHDQYAALHGGDKSRKRAALSDMHIDRSAHEPDARLHLDLNPRLGRILRANGHTVDARPPPSASLAATIPPGVISW